MAKKLLVLFLAFVLAISFCENIRGEAAAVAAMEVEKWRLVTEDMIKQPCDEIYVVREGESLHSISEKCGDPYIIEENPHISDSDDVFPGLIIKITPFTNR